MVVCKNANGVRTSPWSRSIQGAFLVVVFATIGCGTSTEGGPESARDHLSAELDKWIGGFPSTASTMEGRVRNVHPTSYTIESLVRGEPHILAFLKESDTPRDEFETYPSYQANVTLTFKSEAGTPTNRVVSYSMTWSAKHQDWYVLEIV